MAIPRRVQNLISRMSPTERLDTLLADISATDAFLNSQVSLRTEMLVGSIQDLSSDIVNMMDNLERSGDTLEGARVNLRNAQKIHKDILVEFEKMYGVSVGELVTGFDDVTEYITESYSRLGEAAKFTGIDRTMIKTLKDQTYEQFEQFGVEAQNRIAREMYNTVVAGGSYASLKNAIRGILVGHEDKLGRPMTAYAKVYTRDAIMDFHNQVNLSKGEEIGLEEFLYVGDVIQTSRPFCIARVGKVYSRSEIDSWDSLIWQGKKGPPYENRGGWNCRHHWRPVRKEWLEDLDEDVVQSEVEGIVEAPRKATVRLTTNVKDDVLKVQFKDLNILKTWKLPDKSDIAAIKAITKEAREFAAAQGATVGQMNAVRKAMTDAGWKTRVVIPPGPAPPIVVPPVRPPIRPPPVRPPVRPPPAPPVTVTGLSTGEQAKLEEYRTRLAGQKARVKEIIDKRTATGSISAAEKDELTKLRKAIYGVEKRIGTLELKGGVGVKPVVVKPVVVPVTVEEKATKAALKKLDEIKEVDHLGYKMEHGGNILPTIKPNKFIQGKRASKELDDQFNKLEESISGGILRSEDFIQEKVVSLSKLIGRSKTPIGKGTIQTVLERGLPTDLDDMAVVLRFKGKDYLYSNRWYAEGSKLLGHKTMKVKYMDLDKFMDKEIQKKLAAGVPKRPVPKGIPKTKKALEERKAALEAELASYRKTFAGDLEDLTNAMKYAEGQSLRKYQNIYDTLEEYHEVKMAWYKKLSRSEQLIERDKIFHSLMKRGGATHPDFIDYKRNFRWLKDGTRHMSYRLLEELDRNGFKIIFEKGGGSHYVSGYIHIDTGWASARVVAHEVGHGIDALMGNGFKGGWGNTGLVWLDDTKYLRPGDRDRVRQYFFNNATVSKTMDKYYSAGLKSDIKYYRGNWIEKYDARYYGRSPVRISGKTYDEVGNEYFANNVERYQDAVSSGLKKLDSEIDNLEEMIEKDKEWVKVIKDNREKQKQIETLRKHEKQLSSLQSDPAGYITELINKNYKWGKVKRMYPDMAEFIEWFFKVATVT